MSFTAVQSYYTDIGLTSPYTNFLSGTCQGAVRNPNFKHFGVSPPGVQPLSPSYHFMINMSVGCSINRKQMIHMYMNVDQNIHKLLSSDRRFTSNFIPSLLTAYGHRNEMHKHMPVCSWTTGMLRCFPPIVESHKYQFQQLTIDWPITSILREEIGRKSASLRFSNVDVHWLDVSLKLLINSHRLFATLSSIFP